MVGHLIGNIQPPAVDSIFPDPEYRNADQIILHLRVGGVPLWHIIAGREAFVVDFFLVHCIRVDYKPMEISGLFSVFKHILELTALIADMVEYRVNDHPDVSFMGSFYQCGEILVGSEHGIHGKVILNVILVVADGLENRGQIQSVDSQIL